MRSAGTAMPVKDSLIAATALTHHLLLTDHAIRRGPETAALVD